MKTTNKEAGFAHYVLLLVLLLVILIGGAGYTVAHRQPNQDSNLSSSTTKKVSLDPKNTAAAAAKVKTSQVQYVNFNLSTPDGTLNQLGLDLKNNNFDSAAYYVTPGFYFRATKALKLSDGASMSEIGTACKKNLVCRLVLKTTSLPKSFTESSYSYTAAGTQGKILTTYLKNVDSAASLVYGNQKVKFYVVGYDNNSKWVLDKVTVGTHSL